MAAAAARERRLERRREAEQSSVARTNIMYVVCAASTHTTRAADIPFGDIIDDVPLTEFNLTIPIERYRLLMLTYIDRVSYFVL